MIQAYFDQIRDLLESYRASGYTLSVHLTTEMRPGEQGYISGDITFADSTQFHFSEYLDVDNAEVVKLMYTYHYQSEREQLIFRYDNASHKPALAFEQHKHTQQIIVQAPAPALADVLAEISTISGWIDRIERGE